MKLLYLVVLVLVLVTMPAQAQDGQAPAEETAAESQIQPSSPPPTLVGQSADRRSLTGQNGPSYLTGGINITQIYTDNADLNPSGGVHDLSYSLGPHLALTHSTARLSYSAAIFAGFVVNRTLSDRNQADQTGSVDFSYGISQFTSVRFSDSFSNTTGLWSASEAGASLEPSTGTGVVQQPNPSLLTYGRYRANTALGELSHQFALNSIGGIRGTHTYTWFPNAASSSVVGTLYGGQSYSAEVFYDRRFSSRHWFGTTLRAQRFDLDRSAGRTDTLSSIFLYGFAIRPTMSMSFFAGPELSVTSPPQVFASSAPPFSRRRWTPTTGAVFSDQRPRTGVTISFVRGISNSAGLESAVMLTTAAAAVTRQFSRFCEGGVTFDYSRNEPLVPSQMIDTYAAGLQFTAHLTNNMALSGGYGRDENIAITTEMRSSADRVWISWSFSFLKPLGR